jgi:hypothetical protein
VLPAVQHLATVLRPRTQYGGREWLPSVPETVPGS